MRLCAARRSSACVSTSLEARACVRERAGGGRRRAATAPRQTLPPSGQQAGSLRLQRAVAATKVWHAHAAHKKEQKLGCCTPHFSSTLPEHDKGDKKRADRKKSRGRRPVYRIREGRPPPRPAPFGSSSLAPSLLARRRARPPLCAHESNARLREAASNTV